MKNILIIDDDPDLLEILSEILSEMGYLVQKASTVEEGEQSITTHIPELILLDLHLPDKNGSFLAKKLKSQPHTKHIPIILFSGDNNLSHTATTLGVDSYLSKPFDLKKLTNVVNNMLLD